jgi:hypothetical protein
MDSASKVAGKPIRLLNVPVDETAQVTMGASNQPVHFVVSELPAKMGAGKQAYRLLYDPNEGAYYFNLEPIASTTPSVSPDQITVPPTRPAKENPFFIKK